MLAWPVYAAVFIGTIAVKVRDGQPPVVCASRVVRLARRGAGHTIWWLACRPPRRVSAGKAGERVGLLAKRLLPLRAFEAVAKSRLGV